MTKGESFLHNFLSIAIFMTFTSVVMPACSSDPKRVEIPASADARAELSILGRELDAAQTQALDLLSPRNFGKSNEHYIHARDAIEEGKPKKEILSSIGMSRAYLNLAFDNAKRIRPSVQQALDVREEVMRATGAEISSRELTAADNNMKEIVFEAEKSRSTVPSDKAGELTNKYRDLRADSRDMESSQTR